MTEPITFGALVALMVLGGPDSDSVRGVVRRVEGDGHEWTRRIARKGREWERVESPTGRVHAIRNDHWRWARYEGEEAMTAFDVTRTSFASPIGGLDVGGGRPSWSRWDGTDFTRPNGPITQTETHGRRAFAVELAPPSHKPSPMQLVVDAGTGLLLHKGNRDFGWSEDWLEVGFGADLPDELFTWDGPVVSHEEVRARRDAENDTEHKADMARRAEWLTARGLVAIPFPIEPELTLHDWDEDTGRAYLSFDASVDGTVIRRPHSDEPWAEPDRLGYDEIHRWSDARWDWCVAVNLPLSEEALRHLAVRLATTT